VAGLPARRFRMPSPSVVTSSTPYLETAGAIDVEEFNLPSDITGAGPYFETGSVTSQVFEVFSPATSSAPPPSSAAPSPTKTCNTGQVSDHHLATARFPRIHTQPTTIKRPSGFQHLCR